MYYNIYITNILFFSNSKTVICHNCHLSFHFFAFWQLDLPLSNLVQRQWQRWRLRMCIYAAGVCRGLSMPSLAHFWVHFVYTPAWVSCSVRSNEMAVVGQSYRTSRCGYPVFHLCGSDDRITNHSGTWVSAGVKWGAECHQLRYRVLNHKWQKLSMGG